MGKNLKLNIKNLQLAGAFKVKKPAPAEGEAAAPDKKETAQPSEGEPKKRLTRLKEDAMITSALKQAEKTDGVDSPLAGVVLVELFYLYSKAGRLTEGEAIWERICKIAKLHAPKSGPL